MVSPNLTTKKIISGSGEFNLNAKKLFQVVYSDLNKPAYEDDESPRLRVSELISKMAFFYEKIRNAVDYDEDHLLRKNAIARILKRQVRIEGILKTVNTKDLVKHLLAELIRASYLPNNTLPESKVAEVTQILTKYLDLKQEVIKAFGNNSSQDKGNFVVWILTLAACEIEENLVLDQTKQAMVNVMFDTLKKEIELPSGLPYATDLDIQIYLSVSRYYSRFDEDMLSFVLFKYYNQGWTSDKIDAMFSPKEEQIKKIANNIQKIKEAINYQIKHPLKKQLDLIVRRYSLYFTVFQETIADDPVKVYNDFKYNPDIFFKALRKVCNKKYKKAKSKLWRAATRSIIYIFLTKSVFVFLIELPAIHWFNQPINNVALAVNIAFPAILLFIIVSFTRIPGESNTDYIVEGVKEVALVGSERKYRIKLRNPKKRGAVINTTFNIIYSAAFFASIYFIVWVLNRANFNWVSIIIFLFFLAFVSFFSVIVTKGIKELLVIEKKENLFSFLLDLFYMPIIMAGKWLSSNISKINVFIFIFDFIIEAPFKVLIEIAEDWTKYVKERKDNVA